MLTLCWHLISPRALCCIFYAVYYKQLKPFSALIISWRLAAGFSEHASVFQSSKVWAGEIQKGSSVNCYLSDWMTLTNENQKVFGLHFNPRCAVRYGMVIELGLVLDCWFQGKLDALTAARCYGKFLVVRGVRQWKKFVQRQREERQRQEDLWELAVHHHHSKLRWVGKRQINETLSFCSVAHCKWNRWNAFSWHDPNRVISFTVFWKPA